ncbi:MAG: uL15 family ribosomal protein [Rickettsiales bacterium]|nr:uL15 family ribosomal protein [Rickettsiales bacterium]
MSKKDLIEKGIIKKDSVVKLLLGKKEVKTPFKIEVDKYSKAAEEKGFKG